MRCMAALGFVAALVLMMVAVGCDEGAEQAAPSAPASAPMQAETAESSPTSPGADTVIAKSGDLVVTQGEIEEILDKNRKYSMMMSGGKPFELSPEHKKQQRMNAIRNLLLSKLVLLEAKASGLKVTDDEIDEKFETVFKMYGGKEKFLKASGREEISDEQLRKEMVDTILREKYIEREVYSKIPEPTEADMRAWYEKNKGKFGTPETVSAKIITVKVAENASEQDVGKAKERLAALAARLKKGETFRVPRASLSVLDGQVLARLGGWLGEDTYRLNAEGEFDGVDIRRLLPPALREFSGDASMAGNMWVEVDLPGWGLVSSDGGRQAIKELSGRLNITHIGPEALDRALLALDPKEENPSIVQIRARLALAGPRRVLAELERGFVHIEVEFQGLLGKLADRYRVPRFSIAQVLGAGPMRDLGKALGRLSAASKALEALGARQIILGPDGMRFRDPRRRAAGGRPGLTVGREGG